MEKFKTIINNAEAEIVERRSKFIANIYYVKSLEEVEEKLKAIKKKYFDSRHNCYAYRIEDEDTIIERASDDGEPSGTAGAPILNILNKNGTNECTSNCYKIFWRNSFGYRRIS